MAARSKDTFVPPEGARPDGACELVPVSIDMALACGSGIIASGLVTPIILTIDKAVVQGAAGQVTLGKALMQGTVDLLKRPHALIMSAPLWMVWGVYSSTYMAANLIDVYSERKELSKNQHSMGKLVGTTAVNMSASLVKDVAFAKLFGKQVEKAAVEAGKAAAQTVKKVPLSTYACFLCRDTLTIAGGFTVPPLVSAMLVNQTEMEKSRADKVAQLVSPMGMQLICTPLHLLALNMYNEQNATPRERVSQVWKTTPQSTFVRMFRFLGAYGIGGLTNKALLKSGREYTVEKYCSSLK